MCTARLPVVDWTDAPADLNGLVRFVERRNLVSARVPSHFKRSLPPSRLAQCLWNKWWSDWICLCLTAFGKANVDALYLTSWSEIMLEKITVAHKGLPFVWNLRFITVFGKARHWTLNWTRCIQFASQYSVSETILSTSRSPGGFSPFTYLCKCESVSCYVIWRESPSVFVFIMAHWVLSPLAIKASSTCDISVHICHTTLRPIANHFAVTGVRTSNLPYVISLCLLLYNWSFL
jgi:hypothetical protein